MNVGDIQKCRRTRFRQVSSLYLIKRDKKTPQTDLRWEMIPLKWSDFSSYAVNAYVPVLWRDSFTIVFMLFRQTEYTKYPLVVDERVNVCAWSPVAEWRLIQGVFPPHGVPRTVSGSSTTLTGIKNLLEMNK